MPLPLVMSGGDVDLKCGAVRVHVSSMHGVCTPCLLYTSLRESGALEQDADAVILLHRDQDKVPDEIQVIVAKHRHGPSDMVVRLKWEGQFSRAVDLSSGWSPSGRAAS